MNTQEKLYFVAHVDTGLPYLESPEDQGLKARDPQEHVLRVFTEPDAELYRACIEVFAEVQLASRELAPERLDPEALDAHLRACYGTSLRVVLCRISAFSWPTEINVIWQRTQYLH